jgi:hypothetical protein
VKVKKCKKCGSADMVSYPKGGAIVSICMNCGKWHKERGCLVSESSGK